ncbi:glucose-6-phosphate dehydrogenase assembly protein OpcA [Calidifontibacter sp. DB0510]|uniref:Glucose-6-phosphate dehydrogenase assembly protein OpcA n=1 Tax=Metallococcus carri TaxID=1656884 RepID=A0A967AZY7_9MICO|nr:glucose-6-phosphate dehydrogenase assembly protein OpcA [Metallococcus carri]NHN54905.1 glucose-6-phosphate dehydrogenase assembly protein OpcA [Metallococcus carri]NOP37251.1 glucose-6-phosphate dehydrogenase assembly protein OpcA [Calidifontibacter sp. DB2511S]
MIVDLPATTTREVSKALVRVRQSMGAITLGRVMTLIVVTDEATAATAIDAATEASRQHPSRILVLVTGSRRGGPRLDAEIRVGGDAGASEIVVLRLRGELADHGDSVVIPLLLPDSPVVAWWPIPAPPDLAGSPIGKMAVRRITDSSLAANPRRELARRRDAYADGDTDMAWSRTTRWRGLLATALDLEPFEQVTGVTVKGAADSASTDLLAGWLAIRLRCPVRRVVGPKGTGIVSVRLDRESGPIDLVRPAGQADATLTQPDQPVRRISLARPDTADSLAEELSRLDGDEVYRDALLRGLELISGRERAATPAPARAKRRPEPQPPSRRKSPRLEDLDLPSEL